MAFTEADLDTIDRALVDLAAGKRVTSINIGGEVIPFRRRSGYAAAKTKRSTGGWTPADPAINDLIGMSGPAVRARIRQLVRDFPFLLRAKRSLTDYVVGSGVTLQSQACDTRGNYNKQLAAEIEEGYRIFSEEADIAGKLHLKDIERLCRDQETESGEYLLV